MRPSRGSHRAITVIVGALIALAGAYMAVVVVVGIGYMLTPERVCMEGEQPIWEPATGTSKCQAETAITDPGWEVVRVGADRHVPLTLDDPDYRQWERTVRDHVARQQTAPAD